MPKRLPSCLRCWRNTAPGTRLGREEWRPLTSIKGSADTLLEEDLDPAEMREFHRIIADQAGQMRRPAGRSRSAQSVTDAG